MKVSIITVLYNSSSTLTDTIASVYNQTYENIEFILIDGKSTDNSLDIIKSYESAFRLKNISYIWISEKDNGIYDAINKGIKLATGDVIGILNSDDYYNDNLVIGDVASAFQYNNIDCVYGNLNYINTDNKKITRKWISRKYEKGLFDKSWTPAHPTFYCKKEMYIKYGVYRTDFKIAADVELMYRFLEKNQIKSKYLDRLMIIMRQGGVSSRGIKSTIIITKEMRHAYKINGDRLNLLKYLFYKIGKIKELNIR